MYPEPLLHGNSKSHHLVIGTYFGTNEQQFLSVCGFVKLLPKTRYEREQLIKRDRGKPVLSYIPDVL